MQAMPNGSPQLREEMTEAVGFSWYRCAASGGPYPRSPCGDCPPPLLSGNRMRPSNANQGSG